MATEITIWVIIIAVIARTAAYAVYTFRTKNACGGVFLSVLCLLCILSGFVCFT